MLDGRFNPIAMRDDDEWIVIGYKRRNPKASFREIAYTLIDEDLAYLSPSTVYRILKKHDLITPWKRATWESTRPEHARRPDEKWQTDIMYIKIRGRFFYLIIFIDEYSRYIVHHALMTSMDADSVSLEAQAAIEKLRKDSLADPVIQSDNGSSFIAMEFKLVLRENRLLNHSYNGRKKVRRVIDRKLNLGMPNEVWEMDIKYVWIHGGSKNAFLFILMDCFTREEIGHYIGYSCRKDHVRMVTEFAFHDRGSDNIRNLRIRSDNGSQFIARMTGDYLSSVYIPHERIHSATPQEEDHIEAMNSIIERELIRRFEFDSLEDAKNIIDRYMMFYNEERIHSAIGYMTPREMYEKWMEKSQEA